MNTPNEAQNGIDNSAYNPFPEPQTIPSGWDLSGFDSAPKADSDHEEADTVEG
jgi:hypothetical protein